MAYLVMFGVVYSVFCGWDKCYGLGNIRWMGGVCDLNLCNG